jgi:hypothetical protein
MPHSFHLHHAPVGDLVGERLAVLKREHRIRGAVDDQCRRRDRRQRVMRDVALGGDGVVLRRGEVVRPGDVTLDQRAGVNLIERPVASRQDTRVLN